MLPIRTVLARAASPFAGADTLMFYLLFCCCALAAFPSGAQQPPTDSDDDDILVDDEDEPTPVPVARPKVGMATLVPIGKATQPLAEQISSALLEEFKDARFEVVAVALESDDKSSGKVDMNQGQASLKKGTKALARGEGLLKRLRFSRAEKSYQQALGHFEQAAAALEDVSPVVKAYLGLAELNARQGLEEEARSALVMAARVNPEYVLDPGRYPPLFIRKHAEVLGEVLAEEKGTLTVDGTGKGASVFFNGRSLGQAPLTITEVPPGKHFVRVVGEGIGLYGAMVEVTAGDTVTVAPGFSEAGVSTPTDKLAQNRFDDEAAATVAALAKEQGHIGTIVGVVAKSRSDVPAGLLYIDAASGMARRVDVLRFDGDLLNMAIEGLKGREEIEDAQSKKLFASVDDEEPLLEGEKGASELEVPSVALRFEVKAPATKKPSARTGRRRLSSKDGVDNGDKDDDDSGRRLASSGGTRKRTLKGLEGGDDDPLKRRNQQQRKRIDEADDEGSLLTNPWIWTGIAAGGVAAVGVMTGLGGVGVYLLLPPTQADINVNLPE